MAGVTSGREERVRSFFERAWNAKDYAAAEDLYGPKYSDPHVPGLTGGTAKAAAIESYHAAFPDLHMDIAELVACGEQVAVRFRITGTDNGAGFAGRPAGGRGFETWGVNFMRFDGEKVAEEWAGVDYLSVFVHLGVTASPWPQG